MKLVLNSTGHAVQLKPLKQTAADTGASRSAVGINISLLLCWQPTTSLHSEAAVLSEQQLAGCPVSR